MRIATVAIFAVVLLRAVTCAAWAQQYGADEEAVVERVADGLTLVMDDGREIVLLGVELPATKYPAKAKLYKSLRQGTIAFVAALVEGKHIRFQRLLGRTDSSGSGLADVYLDDDTFLNAELIKQGRSFAAAGYSFPNQGSFRQYQREAAAARLGIWQHRVSTAKSLSQPKRKQTTAAKAAKPRKAAVRIKRGPIDPFSPYINNTKVFHRGTCKLAVNAAPTVWDGLLGRGYKPCLICKPPLIEPLPRRGYNPFWECAQSILDAIGIAEARQSSAEANLDMLSRTQFYGRETSDAYDRIRGDLFNQIDALQYLEDICSDDSLPLVPRRRAFAIIVGFSRGEYTYNQATAWIAQLARLKWLR